MRINISEKDTQPLFSASAKKTRRGKECAAFGCSNIFYDSEGTATGIHFFTFPSLPSEINCWWYNLIKRQNNNDGFNVSSSTVLCHNHFMEKGIKIHF